MEPTGTSTISENINQYTTVETRETLLKLNKYMLPNDPENSPLGWTYSEIYMFMCTKRSAPKMFTEIFIINVL